MNQHLLSQLIFHEEYLEVRYVPLQRKKQYKLVLQSSPRTVFLLQIVALQTITKISESQNKYSNATIKTVVSDATAQRQAAL